MKTKTYYNQQGVTLIELMVAMAVSSVIMLGISNIYLSTKQSYVVHDEFSRIQENSRFTAEELSTNIRNAGFFGCSSGQGLGTVTNDLKTSNQTAWNFQTGLMGYEAVGTDTDEATAGSPKTIDMVQSGDPTQWVTDPNLTAKDPAGGANLAMPNNPDQVVADLAIEGSDILVIRTTDGSGVTVARNNNGAQFFAEDINNAGPDANGCISGICDDDIILVSDCAKSIIFQITNVTDVGAGVCGATPCFNLVHSKKATANPGNTSAAWNNKESYGPGSEVMTVVTKTYFVGINNGAAAGPVTTEPSLYVRENDGQPQPLVEGIENMQILYGVDTDGDGTANRYFSANDVPDVDGDTNTAFDGVVSVKLSFLVRTPGAMPGLNRTAADLDAISYAMISPASSINIDPITPAGAAIAGTQAADRRMRKVYNMTVKMRNKAFNVAN